MAFSPDEMRNYSFLNVLLDRFRKLAFDYCAEGDTPQARFERVKEIRKALTEEGRLPKALTGDGPPPNKTDQLQGCPSGQHCEGGACVPDDVFTGWPGGGDPPAWNK